MLHYVFIFTFKFVSGSTLLDLEDRLYAIVPLTDGPCPHFIVQRRLLSPVIPSAPLLPSPSTIPVVVYPLPLEPTHLSGPGGPGCAVQLTNMRLPSGDDLPDTPLPTTISVNSPMTTHGSGDALSPGYIAPLSPLYASPPTELTTSDSRAGGLSHLRLSTLGLYVLS